METHNHRAVIYISQPDEKKQKGAIAMSTNELTKKVRELKELKALAEDLSAEITAIEDEIKAEMTARNTDEMKVDVFKIRWTKVIGNRFDSKRFKVELPEIAERYTVATEYRRLSIA